MTLTGAEVIAFGIALSVSAIVVLVLFCGFTRRAPIGTPREQIRTENLDRLHRSWYR